MPTCDLIVAAKGAKIGIREVKVDYSLPQAVCWTAGLSRLRQGHGNGAHRRAYHAEEALDAGLLSSLTEAGEALPAAIALAERIAENAPLAVNASKTLVRAAAMGIEEDKLWEMQVPLQKSVFSSNDAKEGPVALLRSVPNWTGT